MTIPPLLRLPAMSRWVTKAPHNRGLFLYRREKVDEYEFMGFAESWGSCADQLKALCEAV